MSLRPPPTRLALIACADPWPAPAMQSVLEPAGYRVILAASGAAALEHAARARPDVIWIWARLPDTTGAELCRQLRADRLVPSTTPILVIGAAPLLRGERLDALRAGAWDVVPFPFDAEELLLKLDAFVRSKRDADRAREQALVDPSSGLYNRRGLERRVGELLADAVRRHVPLACVVLGADPLLEGTTADKRQTKVPAMSEHVAGLLHTRGRLSDSIGRWSDSEFAVLAPATDDRGAVKLAERLSGVVESTPVSTSVAIPRLEVRAGYDVIESFGTALLSAQDLLAHASAALRSARATNGGSTPRIRRYSPNDGTARA